MKMTRKNFVPQARKDFQCLNCQTWNTDHLSSPRNHCYTCLYSLHVDDTIPGDRQSTCYGLMKPIKLHYSGAKGYSITHTCVQCGKKMNNKTADDDSIDSIIQLSHI